jgi:hypothetical protein
VELSLPTRQKVDLSFSKDHILFQGNSNLLVVPLRNRLPDIELQGMAGVGKKLIVTPTRNTVLLVPETDRGSGSMAVIAQRMGVDGGLDSLLAG